MAPFLSNNEQFNNFVKELLSEIECDPNYKGSFASKVAAALGKSHNLDKSFDIKTLNHFYQEEESRTTLLFETIKDNLLKGMVRDYIHVIREGLVFCDKNKSHDLYQFINKKTEKLFIMDFENVIKEMFDPEDELFYEKENLITTYGKKINHKYLEKYYSIFDLNSLENIHNPHKIHLINIFLTLKMLSIEVLMSFINDIAEIALKDESFNNYNKKSNCELIDFCWSILENNARTYEKKIYGI